MVDSYCFPPEMVSPKIKEDALYGLQYINAAYYSNNRYGSHTFHQESDFEALIELAQGRQSTDNIRKLFGRHGRYNPNGDGPESIAYLDLQVLNLAPKYINRAVAKMQRMNYDIALEAVDIVSSDNKADFAATVKAYYRFKGFMKDIGIPVQVAFPDLDVSTLPEHPDELLYDLTVNPKIKEEIAGEIALKLVQGMNNFKQILRQVDWNMVVTGMGHIHCFHDANMYPRIENVDTRFWGGSYVDNDDFEQQENAFFYDCISTNQFIKEASGQYTQSQLQEIINRYSLKNHTYQARFNMQNKLGNYDNLDYIPVVRFYFRSEDNRVWVSRKNQYNSKILMEKEYPYIPDEETAKRYGRGGDSKLIQNSYTSIYGGTWIVDSDIVYNYGLKKAPRTNLVDATLPIKTFGTNFKNGRCVSFASQMIEPLYMVNVAWNKIKETLAKGWDGIREINMSRIEGMALGHGGRVWSEREVLELLYMDNTLLTRDVPNPYGQSNGGAITHHSTGVQLADHFSALSLAINMLDQMTGASIPEAAEKPDRPSVWGMKASMETADLDMEYLFNAHEYIYERTSHELLLLTQESLKSGVSLHGLVPALGKVNAGVYKTSDIAYCDYGILLSRQPTQQEWADFYLDLREALIQGRIGASDSAFIRNIDNLKQARQILVIREQQFERKMAQAKQQDIQANMMANEQSIRSKEEADIRIIQEEGRVKAELIKLQGMIKSSQDQDKAQFDGILRNIDNMNKRRIADNADRKDLIREGIRSNAEKYKEDSRSETKMFEVVNRPKPESTTSKSKKK